jgi:hypothetical protein
MTKEATLVAQVASLAKLLATKDEMLAEMRATDAKLLATDAKLLATKDEMLAEMRASHAVAIAAKDEVVRLTERRLLSDANTNLLLLSRLQIILQPRIMIEIALAAKYPTLRTTAARWSKFYETHVVDAFGLLLSEPEKIMLAIDCTLQAPAVRDDLKTVFNRLSDSVHNRLRIPGFVAGICCGGDSAGCANAIAVKLLQDDPDVQAAGLLADDVLFLTPDFSHTRTFKCDGTIVKPDGAIVKPAKAIAATTVRRQ